MESLLRMNPQHEIQSNLSQHKNLMRHRETLFHHGLEYLSPVFFNPRADLSLICIVKSSSAQIP